ncbi:MAG: hypothetical protein KKB20_17655 [Proteobacteria bacterium]|nr:hypothetical protein [Pseudomonadota bacterium]
MKEVGRRRSAANRLTAADPRLKVLLVFIFGLVTWRAGIAGVLLYGLILAAIMLLLGDLSTANRSLIRTYALFVLIWMGVKFVFEIVGGAAIESAFYQTADLGLRLLVLLLLGLSLALSTSSRDLGLAAAWFLRPVLGRRAWQAALALALMIHFLPLAWRTFDTVRRTVAMRAQAVSWPRRLSLTAQAALRALSLKTWDQTVALAARGLDGPEAWKGRFRFRFREWAAGLAAVGVGLAAAWV